MSLVEHEFDKIKSMFSNMDIFDNTVDSKSVIKLWGSVRTEHINTINSWLTDDKFIPIRDRLLSLLASEKNLMNILSKYSYEYAMYVNDILFNEKLYTFRQNCLAHIEMILFRRNANEFNSKLCGNIRYIKLSDIKLPSIVQKNYNNSPKYELGKWINKCHSKDRMLYLDLISAFPDFVYYHIEKPSIRGNIEHISVDKYVFVSKFGQFKQFL